MKKLLFIIGLLLFIAPVYAQTDYNPVSGMRSDFKDIATFSKQQAQGGQGFTSYSSGNIMGSQFFYPGFADGSVTTTNNEVFSGIYQFLFDKVRQELFIISKNDTKQPPPIYQAEKTQIKSFTIVTDKSHVFVPLHNYMPENNTDFCEVLKKNDSAYTLLKLVKTTFVKNNQGDITKMKKGEIYDEFVDKTTYYISYKMSPPREVVLKRNKIINAFPVSEKETINDYFETYNPDEINEQFMIDLVGAINK